MNIETGRSPHERRVQARRGSEGALVLLVSVLAGNTFMGIAHADDEAAVGRAPSQRAVRGERLPASPHRPAGQQP